jgi:NADH-quinone oxidoreductase subunit N
MTFTAPYVDYAGLSPLIALAAGICVVLLAGVFKAAKPLVPELTLAALGASAGLAIWQWGERVDLVSNALRLDELGLAALLIAIFAAAVCVALSIREPALEQAGAGEYCALLLGSVLGMGILAMAQNLVSFFLGLELLSVPLYVLCASEVRREGSLESGLKYLVIGSLGSATLLYGLALIYGGGASTDFRQISAALSGGAADDSLVLVGTAMVLTGLAFKTSLAPFHQWTPDVYQGAPSPITAFMAVATKAAAFAAFVRLLDIALGPVAGTWADAVAALAVISIVVGNVGAISQNSLKRMLGYSSIAQAGYMLAGIVVVSETGVNALFFYLAGYAFMNMAIFAVIVARERETGRGDDISAVEGLGSTRPLLAWPLTIGMLGLAGLPGTVGFMGKLFLIEAAVEGDYTWLGVAIVIGTMVSLAYYLRVVSAMWMKPEPTARPQPPSAAGVPAMAGAAPESPGSQALLLVPAALCAAATIFFGVLPTPLVTWASHVGAALSTYL